MSKELTLAKVKKEVLKIYGQKEDDGSEAFMAGVCLLSSARFGPKPDEIAKFTGYPRGTVRKFAKNLRASGVWKDGKVHVDWFSKDGGGVAFLCDALVAQGLLKRAA